MEIYNFRSRDSQDVWREVYNASGSRFWCLNNKSNNLVLGQPWWLKLGAMDTAEVVNLGFICEATIWGLLYQTVLCQPRRVGSKENASGSQLQGLNNPRDISNNLALGQPWSSELGGNDITKNVNLGLHVRCYLWELFLNQSYASQDVWWEVKRMLREASSGALLMTHASYQTTWRRGSRGRRSWRQLTPRKL